MVSVIIPVYNIESVLKACVDSVLKQTYKKLEIILVDDGSTDSSGVLCDQYAQTDSRVKVFHKTNGGLSDARNYGLAQAHGQYVIYLDGDDWMAEQTIGLVRKKADEYNADYVQCGYYYAYPDYLLGRKVLQPETTYSKERAFRELLTDGWIKNFAWGVLLKKELALKVPFVKGKYFEDIYWKYQILNLSHQIVCLSQPMFFYRQRSNSISSAFSMKNYDLLEGSSLRLEFIRKTYPALFPIALREHWMLAFNFMKMAECSSQEVSEKYKEYLTTLQISYAEVLPKAVKTDLRTCLTYTIYNKYEKAYPVYAFLMRIVDRFKKRIYCKIKY